MKLDWKQITAAFALGLILGPVIAFKCGLMPPFRPGPERFKTHLLNKMSSKLNLDADQKQKVSAIIEETGKDLAHDAAGRGVDGIGLGSVDGDFEHRSPPFGPDRI